MRIILLFLLILGTGGLVGKIQAESLYTLDFIQAEGDPVEWFKARGWEEKEDMRRSMSLLWQWEQAASSSLVIDLRKNEVSLVQA